MSLDVQHTVAVAVLDNDNTSNVYFKKDTTANAVSLSAGFSKQSSGPFTVASAGSKTLSFGDITSPAKGLYLEVNNDCSVTLSGAADPIILRKASGATVAKLFVEGDISSVQVEADQGSALIGSYCLWGDVV